MKLIQTMVHPYYSPLVVDAPSDCNITATYSQSSGMLQSINSTWDTVSVSHIISYSRKFSLGANFRNFCRQICFCEIKSTKVEFDDVIMCAHLYKLVPV